MSADYQDDEAIELHTREEAIQIARAEAKRGYTETANAIAYVSYVPDLEAFCLCEFVPHEGAWTKTLRLLTPSEWLPGEEIQEQKILALAQAGNMVSAIRLHRAKYGV